MSRRTLVVLLASIVLAFVGLAWWVYWTSAGKLQWSVPVVCTLLPLLAGAAFVLARRLLEKRGEKQLEQALAAEGAREGAEVGSARGAEIERLRREFEQAVSALKRSKLGEGQGGAAAALYRLPWYAIIGPPACGKTTVLRNSGLKFPYLPGTGDRLKGVGGTRNCDWWLTNQAILLDTAGRWTLDEDDRDEWLTFLDLLKRHRRGSPLNGVIAAISLAGDDENALANLDLADVPLIAARMRERLDEIISRLGVSLPVYLLFTKCDLISGFVETFGELSTQERRQVWGFTAPLLTGPRREPGTYFAEQFDLLRDALEQHALQRMGAEAGDAVIPKLYEFPAQLAELKDKLTLFVDELFDETVYGETPLLRGAYFTSGTQESTPADLLLEDLAEALNVRPVLEARDEEKKSYFLHDLLLRVVFEDRALASASHAELRRAQKRRRAITGALFAGSALLSVMPTVSCRHNLHALEQTRTLLARATRGASPSPVATIPERASELAAVQRDLDGYASGLQTVLAGFGLYQGQRVKPALQRYYGQALKEWVVRPLVNRSNAQLITIGQQLASLERGRAGTHPDESTLRALRHALKLHLLLSAPRDACAPAPLARQDWLVASLSGLWEEAAPARTKHERAEREQLLTSYLELTEPFGDALALTRDTRSVTLARSALEGDDVAAQLLGRVLARYDGAQRSLSELAGASTVLESSQAIGAAFTREAWLEIARALGDPESFGAGDEDWVFGCGRDHVASVRTAQQREAFQKAYLARYEQHWQRFLSATSARTPGNVLEAETMLSELASRPGVLGTLFQKVKEQTALPPLRSRETELTGVASQAVAGALAKAGASDVVKGSTAALAGSAQAPLPDCERIERSFSDFARFGATVRDAGGSAAESALDQYRRQVESVLAALKTYRADDTKLEPLALAARSALDNVDALLRGHAGSYGSVLRQLLMPPLEGVARIALHEKAIQTERLYCDLVYRPFQEELAGRYPMRADSQQAASLASFQRFLQPQAGSVWTFQSAHLRDFVVLEGSLYRFGGADGAAARGLFREELLSFLNQASRVTEAFFPGGASAARMPFRIRVRGAPGYSLTSFRVGTRSVRYDSGVESWTPVEWPGEQPSSGAALTVVPYQGAGPRPLVVDGEWGLFRILDPRFGARVLERTARSITVGWKPKADLHYIKVDFGSDDPRSPLLSVPFSDASRDLLPLMPPSRIAHGGPGC